MCMTTTWTTWRTYRRGTLCTVRGRWRRHGCRRDTPAGTRSGTWRRSRPWSGQTRTRCTRRRPMRWSRSRWDTAGSCRGCRSCLQRTRRRTTTTTWPERRASWSLQGRWCSPRPWSSRCTTRWHTRHTATSHAGRRYRAGTRLHTRSGRCCQQRGCCCRCRKLCTSTGPRRAGRCRQGRPHRAGDRWPTRCRGRTRAQWCSWRSSRRRCCCCRRRTPRPATRGCRRRSVCMAGSGRRCSRSPAGTRWSTRRRCCGCRRRSPRPSPSCRCRTARRR
mmetsp:Transcript_34636/g.74874  ORF Transcript_34636/g.74874 Transcript_34636/m.74874 type:complete len:275 (-) Transcript_34636:810-1634(-)